uniref:Ig-like domain-containing protein n=1 Tax=Stegastes partitus TaxID=144197 RepID=A0A3B4ZTG1_9TELE
VWKRKTGLMLCTYKISHTLNQSPAEMKRPGEMVKMSCTVSGFDMSSYHIHWTRKRAGSSMEWIGRMRAGSNAEYSSTFQSRFVQSYHLPSSTAYLDVKRLTAEDSGVYFCALEMQHCDALDYWGGGTKVMVSSETPAAPTVFPLVLSCSATGDKVTLGCLARDFYPQSLTFQWNDASGNKLVSQQYPSVQTNKKYAGVSLIQVSRSDGDSLSYQCSVTHSGTIYMKKASKAPITVTLNPPSANKIFNNNQAELECVVAGQDEAIVSETKIFWQINGEHVSDDIKETAHSEGNQYNKTSTLTLSRTDWARVRKVRCSAIREDVTPVIQDLTVHKGDGTEPKVTVHILPEEDIGQEVTLVCLVSSSTLQDYYIAWSEDKGQNTGVFTDGVNFPPQKTENGYSVTSLYTTTKEKWNGDYKINCNVWSAGRDKPMKPRGVSKVFWTTAHQQSALICLGHFFLLLSFLKLFFSTIILKQSLISLKYNLATVYLSLLFSVSSYLSDCCEFCLFFIGRG